MSFGAHHKNINEDRPYCQRPKCIPKITVSSNIRFIRIFMGVRWTGGVKWECGRIFGDFRPICRHISTRKLWLLCYRKDDRAMRPIYMGAGCPEHFRDSLTMLTATFPKIFMGFCSDSPWTCVQNLKFVALADPEISGSGYPKNLASPWICSRSFFSKKI